MAYFELTRDEYFDLVKKVFPELHIEHMAVPEALDKIAKECFIQSWRLHLCLQYTKLYIETKRILSHLKETDILKFYGE